ncbi:MAG TPA: autotransporter outer membrane beta-barrel domain-containing protein, partial [Chlamydiales bacterium]|nr:autotransporter outer membrane beta-barrel domain-containing protein [Chlamydiales bacterium]
MRTEMQIEMQIRPVLLCMFLLISNTLFNPIFANIPNQIKDITDILFPKDPDLELKEAEILPTRLSFPTFASQNGYIAFAQVVTDHLDQKRFSPPTSKEVHTAALFHENEDFMADASQKTQSRTCPTKPCYQEGFLTGWLGAFGEYAHEKPQPDVAAFTFNVGGAVLGLDYNCVDENVVGFGGSYVYSRVNDDADAGHSNVNQGLFGFYTMLHTSEIYCNLGLFGGYYHIDQVRNMPILGTLFVASSDTHGWQFAPHAEIGYDGYLSHVCNFEWFGIGPFVLADWVANWEQ